MIAAVPLLLLLTGIAQAQDEDSARRAEELFNKLDRNGDGTIAADEVPEEQGRFFDRLVRIGDRNDDGQLTKEEFVSALERGETPRRRPGGFGPGAGQRPRFDPRRIFERLDQNGDGKLTLEELPEQARARLKPLFDRLGKQELTAEDFARIRPSGGFGDPGRLFERFDENKDGKLTAKELESLPEFLRRRIQPLIERAGEEGLTREAFARAFGQRPGAGGPPRGGDGPAFLRKLDTDRDGRLSRKELAAAVERFDELDTNGDGVLDGRELFGGPPGERPRRPEEGTRRRGANRPEASRFVEGILQRFDKNEDGKLSKDELPERIQERFDQLDRNGDGILDREELARIARGRRRPQEN